MFSEEKQDQNNIAYRTGFSARVRRPIAQGRFDEEFRRRWFHEKGDKLDVRQKKLEREPDPKERRNWNRALPGIGL
jgi:hypothetical protein